MQAASVPAINPAATAVTAFVGRTLRGPLDRPVKVDSFADFQRHFGGLWQPSMLSYAVAQFFERGGRSALIVRVANGARSVSITLPGPAGPLRLRGLNPGTRECLRAAVDYDGIPEGNDERFNLVLQRLEQPGTELIEDQEIFPRISVRSDAERSVIEALGKSRLVRLEGSLPAARPAETARHDAAPGTVYIASAADGDDGGEISDYDVIGSDEQGTGLAALIGCAERFGLLCIPPLARERDVGLVAWLVAARLCRDRQALLLVDPPRDWDSADQALASLRDWPLNSTDACMFYPRLTLPDRLRGRAEVFAPCGTVAAMIAVADARTPPWCQDNWSIEHIHSPAQLAVPVSDPQRERLARMGVNTLRTVRGGATQPTELLALMPERSVYDEMRRLPARRLTQCIVASVMDGTRWALLEAPDATLWQRLRAQVEVFLESCAQQGAWPDDGSGERYFVICDEQLNMPAARGRALQVLFGFAPLQASSFISYLLTHTADATTARPVSVNRGLAHLRRAPVQLGGQLSQGSFT